MKVRKPKKKKESKKLKKAFNILIPQKKILKLHGRNRIRVSAGKGEYELSVEEIIKGKTVMTIRAIDNDRVSLIRVIPLASNKIAIDIF